MITSQHSTNGQTYIERLRKGLQQKNVEEIEHTLSELEAVCRSIPVDASHGDKKPTTTKDELMFWLIDVARLMLEENSSSTRRHALNALESAIPHLLSTNYQDLPVWAELRVIISRDYTSLLDTARSEKHPNWHRMWSVLVRIMNRDLCQGSSIINMFLSIVEAGFRSPELSIREQSFDCWRLLVQVFADNKQINLPKRMKLICIPLKSSKSKTESIAMKKFDIWWFLLNQLRTQLDALADTIFEPFIYFCFGPSFQPPLCFYFDETYKDYGSPGKTYQAIKQLSAIGLIHLLGPATEASKSLLTTDDAGGDTLSFDFPANEIAISPLLFSTKAKLLIDACIECTVLFAQMKHLNYLELNRCLWGNLMERINVEKTVPKNELLQRVKEVTNALLKLCIKQESDVALRELLYDTLLIIARSDLLTVAVGYDSPEQPMVNYKSFMSVILHPELPCPINTSEGIIKHVFGLERYTSQNRYWEMLQKTVQYLCDTDGESSRSEFRKIRTQIYCHLASYLIVQIRDDSAGFAEHQSTVMSFLLYPLEYDQLLLIDDVKSLWDEVYAPIASQEKESCDFTNTFCEMIKAMTIAKFAFNLTVVADFFCTILRSLSVEFDPRKPPMKVFELFKDLTRKAQAYQANLYRVEKMVHCFRELLEKMNTVNMLAVVLPIRNAINEMVSNEKSLAMEEVKKSLNVLAKKMTATVMVNEFSRQPKEVKWSCKMLLKMMLELPADVKKDWKQTEMIKCMVICDDKEAKTPTRKKAAEEFVVIESVWKFKPEVLTEHQREKMMEKRSDIPALYNDMSQSQDSFVIKPWTPSKSLESIKRGKDIVSSTAENMSNGIESNAELIVEIVVPDSEPLGSTSEGDELKIKPTRPDKENNNGNVLAERTSSVKVKEELCGSGEEGKEDTTQTIKNKTFRKRSILEQLRIDTVEGKTLDVMKLPRTRQSEGSEQRSSRRKSSSSREEENGRKFCSTTKKDAGSGPAVKHARKKDNQKEARSSRKLLNFENSKDNALNENQSASNTSDDVIESSQIPVPSQALIGRKVTQRKSMVEESISKPTATVHIEMDTITIKQEEAMEVQQADSDNAAPVKVACEHMEVVCITNDQPDGKSAPGAEKAPKSILTDQKQKATLPLDTPAEERDKCESDRNENVSEGQSLGTTAETVKDNSERPVSPSRRASLLVTDDDSGKANDPPRTQCSDTNAIEKETDIVMKSPRSFVIGDKGTPTKLKNLPSDSSVRAALQLYYSPRRNSSDRKEEANGDSRIGSPKMALYSPLVVVEPMKNYPLLLKKDTEINKSSAASRSPDTDEPTEVILKDSAQKEEATPTVAVTRCSGDINNDPAVIVYELSPTKNLDEEMEPLNKSFSHTIVSTPDLVDAEERNADMLNNTLNISPIMEEKDTIMRPVDSSVLAGSADRRLASKSVEKERDSSSLVHSAYNPTMSRRIKPSTSLQMHGNGPSNPGCSKALRTPQNQPSLSSSVLGTPRSPSTSMIGFGGRGAQLISLIRNQHSDQSPRPSTPPQNASTPMAGHSAASANRLLMRKRAIAANVASAALESTVSTAGVTLEGGNRDKTQYLVFSKELPSALASPATSILKRRHDDSGDDIESPINKRKRVSFHDPPVSITKEYIRQEEECRSPSISRCLQLATSMSSADKAKYMMRRRSKSDSFSELQNFTKKHDSLQAPEAAATTTSDAQGAGATEAEEEELTSSPESLDDSQFIIHDATDNMKPLQVTAELMDVDNATGDVELSSVDNARNSPAKSTSSPLKDKSNEVAGAVRFQSEEAVLEHIMGRYTLDDIVGRYLAIGHPMEHGKSVRLLTKELSSVMSKDPKTRHLVLDELSERHSVEFLEHAIQENSSATVCQQLSLTAMIDHIFKRLQSDANDTGSKEGGPSTMLDEKDDSLQVIQSIYEKLANLPNIESNGQTLRAVRDRFLRKELTRKSRLEIMGLLEEYFTATAHV